MGHDTIIRDEFLSALRHLCRHFFLYIKKYDPETRSVPFMKGHHWCLVAQLRTLSHQLGYKKPPLEQRESWGADERVRRRDLLYYSCDGQKVGRLKLGSVECRETRISELKEEEIDLIERSFDPDYDDKWPKAWCSANSTKVFFRIRSGLTSPHPDDLDLLIDTLGDWEHEVDAARTADESRQASLPVVSMDDPMGRGTIDLFEGDVYTWNGTKHKLTPKKWILLRGVLEQGHAELRHVRGAFNPPAPDDPKKPPDEHAKRVAASMLTRKLKDAKVPLAVRKKGVYFVREWQ